MQQENRAGSTKITSVSVSKEFQRILEEYELSPTEVFRRGIAATLCDMGVPQYQTTLNDKRVKYVKEFMQLIEKDEKLREFFEKLRKLSKDMDKI